MRFNDDLQSQIGRRLCKNGRKVNGNGDLLCPPIGKIRHLGSLFNSTNDETGGLPITANAEVVGLTGGFGWVLQLDDGSPKQLEIDQVEVDASTPLMLAIPYPAGTTFSITAHSDPWCHSGSSYTCAEDFVSVDSVDGVRHSEGNTYYYDTTTSLLYIRVIQFPGGYTGDTVQSDAPTWHLWDLDTSKSRGSSQYALDRFTFNGITLPKFAWFSKMVITAECAEGSVGYCANTPTDVELDVCAPWPGYVQVSYDKCCDFAEPTNCNDFTAAPSHSPTTTAPPTTTASPVTAAPTNSPTVAPTYGGTNLVANSNFEDGTTRWRRNGGGVIYAVDDTEKHSGSQSLLVTNRDRGHKGVYQDMMGDLVAGTTYKIACWAKVKGEGSGAGFILGMKINRDYRNFRARATINSEDWTKVEGVVTIDDITLTALHLWTGGLAAGVEYWVDDFFVVSVSSESMFSEIA